MFDRILVTDVHYQIVSALGCIYSSTVWYLCVNSFSQLFVFLFYLLILFVTHSNSRIDLVNNAVGVCTLYILY